MTMLLYLLLVAATLLHPVEPFFPALVPYRPVMVLGLAVLALALAEGVRRGTMAAEGRHILLLGMLVLMVGVSVALAGWPGGALPAMVGFTPSALLFVTTVLIVTDRPRLAWAAGTIVLCMLLLSLGGIAAFHHGFMVEDLVLRESTGTADYLTHVPENVIPAEDTSGTSLWRIHSFGILSDPNDFSQAIVMSLPLLFAAWRRRRPLGNLLRVLLPATVLLYAIYLTHSRGAVLGLAAVLLLAFARRLGRFRSGLLIGLFAVGAVVAGFTGGRDYSSGDASAEGRIDAWSAGLGMLRAHPLTGVGYGNFTEHNYLTAHNSFVLGFAELGLLGYFAWVALLVLAWRETARAAAMAPDGSPEQAWPRRLRLSLAGFLTCALFLSRTYQPTLFLLLGLCLAGVHVATEAADPQVRAAQPPLRWVGTTLLVMAASILITYLVVRLQYAFLR